ncbi:MAG TPA: hypothetical protein VND19_19410 [Acetobacteraceae bacterium]|nr:hypothetical protein [Acetobacteraceae bacterium]
MIKQVLATAIVATGMLFAGAAMAQTRSYPPVNGAPAWQDNNAARQRARSIGDTYTSALNDLYARGFHDVRRLRMRNGMVHAAAVSPHGVRRTIAVDPGSGQISTG